MSQHGNYTFSLVHVGEPKSMVDFIMVGKDIEDCFEVEDAEILEVTPLVCN